jgi:oligosaccharide reducing-end xylanase
MKRVLACLLVLTFVFTAVPVTSLNAATGGYYSTGSYRNVFVETGRTETQVKDKLDSMFDKFFKGDTNNQRLFYESGSDEAYIRDTGNSDVRSEGMSYGMMICVQMDKKKEFDMLWKWARNHMYQSSGQYKGFFSWQCNYNGGIIDTTPASDGDEYFAMALLFAARRWGNGTGIFNYEAEAQTILDAMLHQADDGVGVNMFDKTQNQVVFCPNGGSATFTDPSYHLPAFYELWALWDKDANDRTTWTRIAATSREFFKKSTHATTGLNPDYANFDGTPKDVSWSSGHADFRYDAWRVALNISVDYAWWQKDAWASTTFAPRIQSFFQKEGISTHGSNYTLAGSKLNNDHSPGLVAMNAVTALSSDVQSAKPFVDELWNTAVPSGQYRYYDGMLYMLGMLHLSGNFKIWGATPSFLCGDVNKDNAIDALDSALLKSYLLGKTSTLPSVEAADTNADGSVDAIDFAILQQYLLGKIGTLPYK